MRVLALDAATEACSVALQWDEQVLERTQVSGKAHSQTLLAMAQELLAEAGTNLGALDGIVASVGPGAFTGVRITVSVAQGLAFGADLPTVGGEHPRGAGCAGLQSIVHSRDRLPGCAHGGSLLGLFRRTAPSGAWKRPRSRGWGRPAASCCRSPNPMSASDADSPLTRHFRNCPESRSRLRRPWRWPRARDFARLGILRLSQGGGRDPAELQPVYLRDKVAFTEAERAPPVDVISEWSCH